MSVKHEVPAVGDQIIQAVADGHAVWRYGKHIVTVMPTGEPHFLAGGIEHPHWVPMRLVSQPAVEVDAS